MPAVTASGSAIRPRIYVGEYAVNSGVGQGNLLGALAEAVFMLNMEKNSDIVRMCSYAPLFENVNSREWPVNLIRFDNSQVVGRTSYYVQRLFSENRPDEVLRTTVTADSVTLSGAAPGLRGGPATQAARGTRSGRGAAAEVKLIYALAGMDNVRKELVVKVVNPTANPVSATVIVNAIPSLARTGKVITLGHASNAVENTLENRTVVMPVEKPLTVAGQEFRYDFTPNSLTILRIPAP